MQHLGAAAEVRQVEDVQLRVGHSVADHRDAGVVRAVAAPQNIP